jgi:transcriptional regulator GlxA family with amidase domain
MQARYGIKDNVSTFTAKMNCRIVVIVVYHGVTLLDVSGPAQVFTTASNEMILTQIKYRIELVSLDGGLVETDCGVKLETRSIDEVQDQDISILVVAGGNGVFDALHNRAMVDWLKKRIPAAKRIVSTCMGAFLTAETGLLGNMQITTHWKWCGVLQAKFPQLTVRSEPIFITQGKFTSTAGVASGIDWALSLVEEDHGRALALKVAKSLVLYLKRTGGQSQFSSLLQFQSSEFSNRFERLNSWILNNLDKGLTVEALAKQADMSERSFARLYAKHTGMTPAKAVEIFRFEEARRLLETTRSSLKAISHTCGFKDYERMRRTFVRHIDISPIEYRRRFGT